MKFKKPKFWDLKKPNLLSYLLLPLTIPVRINNYFLKKKIKKKLKNLKTICVGNIYIGGTGKTSVALKIYELLSELKFSVSVGKKFYKSHIDEKIILEKKSKLICSKSRLGIINKGIETNQNIIIFDDGLQDKNISYDLEFVCFDAENWIGNGHLIPSGPLREKISSLKKYDAVFLKSNNEVQKEIIETIKMINPNIEIFEIFYEISNIDNFDTSDDYLIFSGIGNPNNFKNTLLRYNFNIKEVIIFPDHYNYNQNDIKKIKLQAKKINAKIITTEKDYVRISKSENTDIDFIEVDLIVKNRTKLIDFIKLKINE